MNMMDESAFENLAEQTLARLEAGIEDQLDVDVEYRGGILTVELDDGRQYVINKHTPNRQIWLSSPVSGAAHFDYDQASQSWKSTRGGAILHDLLARELKAATGEDITFD
jgi:frataxin